MHKIFTWVIYVNGKHPLVQRRPSIKIIGTM